MTNEKPTNFLSDDLLTSQGQPTSPKGFVRPTISESLARDVADPQADFFIINGRPIVVWTDQDYACDYSVAPIREVSAFVIFGDNQSKVDAEFFSARVKEIHKL